MKRMTRFSPGSRLILLYGLAMLWGMVDLSSRGAEAQAPLAVLPSNPTEAWTEVSKVHEALRPPPDWRTQPPSPERIKGFQDQVRTSAIRYAAKAREFVQRFPTDENVGDARITVVYALAHAVAAGDSASELESMWRPPWPTQAFRKTTGWGCFSWRATRWC
jgi:hypothetical protein